MAGNRLLKWLAGVKAGLDMFLFGAAMSWVAVPHALRRRREMERLFTMITAARIMGLPCLPPSSELKLLPYFVPNLMYWRRMTIFSRELEGVDLKHIGH